MQIPLAYGSSPLVVELPDERTTVLVPRAVPGLPDERTAVLQALETPIQSLPLRDRIRPGQRVCIAFTDITRATPNDRLIPWLLEALAGVPPDHITLLNQLGTHRPNTPEELRRLLTPAVVDRYRVLNHEPENPDALVAFGATGDGTPALLNRHLAEADLRIITGFIEPHFFAGFSGGPKGIIPGCAGLRTVMSNHRPEHIGHPNATFGVTRGNPLWEELRDIALRIGPSFLLNVTLNESRRITGVFAGDLLAAHAAGTAFVRQSAMQPVPRQFDIVVTTNSGYPLDQNLYQAVKGLSAGARILKPGGLLLLAAECREGVPAGSPFERLLHQARDGADLLRRFSAPGHTAPEQWQVQILAQVLQRARIAVRSEIPEPVLRACHLEPCGELRPAVLAELDRLGREARVAVLPQGPLTIPYLDAAG